MIHREKIEEEWREENLPPFNELILSWNAMRPSSGRYLFYVSIKTIEWSPWLLYAAWGSEGQSSYSHTLPEAFVKVYQDTLETLEGKYATGFQIKILTEGNAPLNDIHALHIYTNGDTPSKPKQISFSAPFFLLVKGLSQMALSHSRNTSLCSPVSTTAVLRFLSDYSNIDPIDFAQNVWDGGFDIFGNWIFNVAQASTILGPTWNGWVERLQGFRDIYQQLQQGIPVVVSVRGHLPGSPIPYDHGHLIVVIGYDSQTNHVICMDPAFPTDSQTHVTYPLTDFFQAWSQRGKVAYIFSPKPVALV